MYDRVPGVTNFEPVATSDAAETFRGVDIETGDPVTVKVLASQVSDEQFDRFTSTCRAVRAIDRHPNIAKLYDAGTTSDGHPYLVVEYQDRTLADLIAVQGRLRWQEAVAVGAEVASALETAHRMNVVHGEVTPTNILMAHDDVPRLSGFGVRAIQTAPDTTSASGGRSTMARLAHTAPEVVQGRAGDERSDVYSLASTLFEALCGTAPFIRSSDESVVPVVSRLLGEPPPSLATGGVPAAVEAAIVGAMAKDPAQRPSSAELFRQELLAAARSAAGPDTFVMAGAAGAAGAAVALGGSGASRGPAGRRPDRTRSVAGGAGIRRRRGLVDVSIAVVALIAVVAIVWVTTHSSKKNDASSLTTPNTGTVTSSSATVSIGPTSTSVAKTTTTRPTTTAAPTTTTSSADPTGPTTTIAGGPSTTQAPTTNSSIVGNTVTFVADGFHLTSFTNDNGGLTITFPADKQYHYFKYSIEYAGGKKPLKCPGHTGLQKVEGPGLANLWLGGCLKNGRTNTQMRIRAYSPGKVTFTLYLCDQNLEVSYCNGGARTTNGVDLTVIAT